MKYKYIISAITTYCEDEELYFTKVGIDNKYMPLLYSVWGNTEQISRDRAQHLVDHINEIENTVHKVI